jgi:SsrA-binding protein
MRSEIKIVDNRKAHYNYTLLDEYLAGIVLNGCEIKSIRNRKVNMSDAYCSFINGELFIKNMHIAEYDKSDKHYGNLEPKRDRKLLLKKQELRKLNQKVKTRGFSIVPLLMIIDEHGFCKIKIALATGKHTYDKSKAIKERDLDREMKRIKF